MLNHFGMKHAQIATFKDRTIEFGFGVMTNTMTTSLPFQTKWDKKMQIES